MVTDADRGQTLIAHLLELRSRLIRVVVVVLVLFAALAHFAGELFTAFAGPLMARLPEGSTMIAVEVASPFLTPFKLALFVVIGGWRRAIPGAAGLGLVAAALLEPIAAALA